MLPAAAMMQPIGMRDDVAAFMAKNAHAFGHGAALDVEHHFLLKPEQAWMSEIKRDGDARRAIGRKPLARNPGMRPHPDVVIGELAVKRVEAFLQPRAFDGHFEVLEPDLQQLVVGQLGPRIFWPKLSTRHDDRGPHDATGFPSLVRRTRRGYLTRSPLQ